MDDDDESIDENIIALLAFNKNKPFRIPNYVEKIVANYTTLEFQQHFRVSRTAFEFLLEQFHVYLLNHNIKVIIGTDKQLLSVIWMLSTNECYRSIGERFDLGKSSLSKIFYRIIDFLVHISSNIIKFPNSNEKKIIKRHFKQYKKLDGIIGAIDGTYIKVKPPKTQKKGIYES